MLVLDGGFDGRLDPVLQHVSALCSKIAYLSHLSLHLQEPSQGTRHQLCVVADVGSRVQATTVACARLLTRQHAMCGCTPVMAMCSSMASVSTGAHLSSPYACVREAAVGRLLDRRL